MIHNLLEAMSIMHKCPTKLAVLVFGAFGEVLETKNHMDAIAILKSLGVQGGRLKSLLEQCSYNVATSSAKILIRRLTPGRI